MTVLEQEIMSLSENRNYFMVKGPRTPNLNQDLKKLTGVEPIMKGEKNFSVDVFRSKFVGLQRKKYWLSSQLSNFIALKIEIL